MPRELNRIYSFHGASVFNQRYDPAMRLSILNPTDWSKLFQIHLTMGYVGHPAGYCPSTLWTCAAWGWFTNLSIASDIAVSRML